MRKKRRIAWMNVGLRSIINVIKSHRLEPNQPVTAWGRIPCRDNLVILYVFY